MPLSSFCVFFATRNVLPSFTLDPSDSLIWSSTGSAVAACMSCNLLKRAISASSVLISASSASNSCCSASFIERPSSIDFCVTSSILARAASRDLRKLAKCSAIFIVLFPCGCARLHAVPPAPHAVPPAPVVSTKAEGTVLVALSSSKRFRLQQRIAAVALHHAPNVFACGQLLPANALDRLNTRVRVGGNSDGRQLQPLPFRELLAPSVFDVFGSDRPEPDGQPANKARFDGLPGFVQAILERTSVVNRC